SFVARDSTEGYYSGFAYRQPWAQARYFPGAVGLVTAARRASPGLSVFDLYLQIEQGVVTPTLHIGNWLRTRLDANLIVIGSYAVPFSRTEDDGWGFGAAVLLDGAGQLMLGAPDAVFSAELGALVQLAPGLSNIAGSSPTVFVNHGLVAGDARVR